MDVMPVKIGPAGVPLSCKGRTIVEGMLSKIPVLAVNSGGHNEIIKNEIKK